MTLQKPRPPLSIDAALARIAGQLPGGWAELGELVQRAESTVRAWGDHDKPEQVPLPCAPVLDAAYRRAGGAGWPLLDAHIHLSGSGHYGLIDPVEIKPLFIRLVREGGDAEVALAELLSPDADDEDLKLAYREVGDQVVTTREVFATLEALMLSRGLLAAPRSFKPPDTS